MSLSALSYKYIGKFTVPASTTSGSMATIATAFSSTTYADGTSRVTGSGVAWTPYSQISTGTTIAVALTPVTSTLGQKIVYAGGATGTPTMISPDAYSALRVNFGLCKNAGSYNSWANANPFTTGEFSGYTAAWTGTSISHIHVYESLDSLFVIGETSAGSLHYTLVGALIDPESTTSGTGESDGIRYALFTTGYTNPGEVAFNTQGTANLFASNGSAGTSHSYVMIGGSSNSNAIRRLFNMSANQDNYGLKNNQNEYVKIPIHLSISTIGTYVGRLREISMFANGLSVTKFEVSGVTDGYLLGTSTASTSNLIHLKA